VHHRNQCRITIHFTHRRVHIEGVVEKRLRAEVHAAVNRRISPVQFNLIHKLPRTLPPLISKTIHPLTNIEMLAECITAPPLSEYRIISNSKADRPIQLRSDIINPSLLQPLQHVSVKIVIVSLTRPRIGSEWILITVSPYAERTDPKLHMRTLGSDAMRQFFNEVIDVASPPVSHVLISTTSVILPCTTVGKLNIRNAIGIEVIIKMYGVKVVVTHRLHNRIQHKLARLGMT